MSVDTPDMNSEAVLDRETGLVWQRVPSMAGTTYQSPVRGCAHANTGGRYGWRMPTVEELASLLDPGNPVSP